MSRLQERSDMSDGRKTNFFTELPADVIQNSLAENLTLQSMARLSGTSLQLYNLFNSDNSHNIPWKINLISQLGVKREELAWLDKLKQEGKISFSYRELYRRYSVLPIRLNIVSSYKYISDCSDYRIFLLASAVNDPYFLTWIPRAMLYDFHMWTICADASVIHEDFLRKCTDKQIVNLMDMAIRCRNISIIKSLTTLKNEQGQSLLSAKYLGYGLSILNETNKKSRLPTNGFNFDLDLDLLQAIRSSQSDVIEELLAIKDELGQPKLVTLRVIGEFVRSGNFARVIECLTIKDRDGNPKYISPFYLGELINVLSGSLELFRQLVAMQDEHGKPIFTITKDILEWSLKENYLDIFYEILAMKDENGFPLVKLKKSIIREAIRYARFDVALKLLELKDEAGNFQIEVDEIDLYCTLSKHNSAIKRPWSLDFYRHVLALKDKNGASRFAPPAEFRFLHSVLIDGLPIVLHEMLALKDENGGPILVPASNIFSFGDPAPLANIHVLCSYKNANGKPNFVPLRRVDNIDTGGSVIEQVLTAYTSINDARVAISKRNFSAAEIAFNEALAHAPVVFFNEVKTMITNPHQALGEDMLRFFEAMVKKLFQAELAQKESSWTIDQLKALQVTLQALKEENANAVVIGRSHRR